MGPAIGSASGGPPGLCAQGGADDQTVYDLANKLGSLLKYVSITKIFFYGIRIWTKRKQSTVCL